MGEVFFRDEVDLYGDPVPIARGKKGRPAHVPTTQFRRLVQLMLACENTDDQIAAALRISKATLKRHYFHELAGRAAARLRLEMKNLDAIVGQVEAGKTAAMALLAKRIDKLQQRETAGRYQAKAPSGPALGKKEAAKVAANEVSGKYAPRPQRTLLN